MDIDNLLAFRGRERHLLNFFSGSGSGVARKKSARARTNPSYKKRKSAPKKKRKMPILIAGAAFDVAGQGFNAQRDEEDNKRHFHQLMDAFNGVQDTEEGNVFSSEEFPSFQPGTPLDRKLNMLLVKSVSHSPTGLFTEAVSTTDRATILVETLLRKTSNTWGNMINNMPKCVASESNFSAEACARIMESIVTGKIAFDDIPLRTKKYCLTFGQRLFALYALSQSDGTTQTTLQLKVSTEWLAKITAKGKRREPYTTSLSAYKPSRLQLMTCVTGFGKTITALLVAMMDVCQPKLWEQIKLEGICNILEQRSIYAGSGMFEGGPMHEQTICRAILIVCARQVLVQWEDAAIDMAHGIFYHYGRECPIRIHVLRTCRFNMQDMADADPNDVFVILAEPTTQTRDSLRKYPNLHFVTRIDDEMVTHLREEHLYPKRGLDGSLVSRYRVLESLPAKRHLLVNATYESIKKVLAIDGHPLRELLRPHSAGMRQDCVPQHYNLAKAIVKNDTPVVEAMLDQYARLNFLIMPPILNNLMVSDVLSQMPNAFDVFRVRCCFNTLDGAWNNAQGFEMLPNSLQGLVMSLLPVQAAAAAVVPVSLGQLFAKNVDGNNLSMWIDDIIHRFVVADIDVAPYMPTLTRFKNRVQELCDGAECAVCMESMRAPRSAVVMRCCTNLICGDCVKEYERCAFCRAPNAQFSCNLHEVQNPREAIVLAQPENAELPDVLKRLSSTRKPLIKACISTIEAMLEHHPYARLLIGVHHREGKVLDNFTSKIKEKWPHASVEDIEHLGSADECAEKREQFNNVAENTKPFIWVIDSRIESDSIAGIDLHATTGIIMTVGMSQAAQEQLAGRATRRTMLYNVEQGHHIVRSNILVIILDTQSA